MAQIVFYESIKTEKAGTCIPALPKTKLEFTPKLINNNGLGYFLLHLAMRDRHSVFVRDVKSIGIIMPSLALVCKVLISNSMCFVAKINNVELFLWLWNDSTLESNFSYRFCDHE